MESQEAIKVDSLQLSSARADVGFPSARSYDSDGDLPHLTTTLSRRRLRHGPEIPPCATALALCGVAQRASTCSRSAPSSMKGAKEGRIQVNSSFFSKIRAHSELRVPLLAMEPIRSTSGAAVQDPETSLTSTTTTTIEPH
ncbi:hypothetical protein TgHK011_006616 [Trichoderma gracile]|nr:hypothetical protein TgHK011_006616 [Trichoderma gracile]